MQRNLRWVRQAALAILFGLLTTVVAASDFGNSTGGGPNDPPPDPPCGGSGNGGNCNRSGSGGSGGACPSGGGNNGQGGNNQCPNSCEQTSQSQNPVDYFSGRERHAFTDMIVKGVYPISLVRYYDSGSQYDSALGYGWAFAHDRRLYEYPDNSVVIRLGCGQRNKFTLTAGKYQPPAGGIRGELKKQGDGSFVFTYLDGTEDVYDAEGRLTAQRDLYGNQLEFVYGNQKIALTGTSPNALDTTKPLTVARYFPLQRIQERLADGSLTGRYVDFTYNAATGRQETASSHDGRTVTYHHDELTTPEGMLTRGNLVQVDGLEGHTGTYKYEDSSDAHNLTYLQDGVNATPVINTYDTKDRVTNQKIGNDEYTMQYTYSFVQTKVTRTIRDANGQNPVTALYTYEFSPYGFTTKEIDPYGNEVRHTYNNRGRSDRKEIWQKNPTTGVLQLHRTEDLTYDTKGNVTQKIVGKITWVKNNECGSAPATTLLNWFFPAAHAQPIHNFSQGCGETIPSGSGIVYTYRYEGAWIKRKEIYQFGTPSAIHKTEYEFNYNSESKPISIASETRSIDASVTQTKSYRYNSFGQLAEVTYADGTKRVYLYENGSHYPTRVFYQVAGSPLAEMAERYEYDTRGNRIKRWDARNNLTEYEYDHKGRMTVIRNPLNEETLLHYMRDQIDRIEVGRFNGQPGKIKQFVINGENRITTIQRIDGNGQAVTAQTMTYDSAGRRLSIVDAEGNTTRYAYDLLDRLISHTSADNAVTQYSYDAVGNRVTMIAPDLKETTFEYDAMNRMSTIVQKGVTPNITTRFTYNALNRLLSVTDGNGNRTQYTYDLMGRKLSEIRPMGQTLQYVYDNRNRLDYMIGARGQKIDYSHHAWGGLQSIGYFLTASATTAERTQTFQYDAAGNQISATDSAIQSGALFTASYDTMNRIDISTYHYLPGGDRVLDYGYDWAGNRNSLALTTNGQTINHSYSHDALNRLESAVLNGQAYSLDYHDNDRLETMTYPNGVTQTYEYEPDGAITGIAVADGSTELEQMGYDLNEVNNITGYDDSDGQYTYDYDGVNRLTDMDYPASLTQLQDEEYRYDAVGNREHATDNDQWQYNANNQLTRAPQYSYQFDADGNQTSRTVNSGQSGSAATYIYDLENRFVLFESGSTSAQYSYDPSGRRIRKSVNGQTTWYLWDGTSLIAEVDGNGNLLKRYAYLPNHYAPIQVADVNGEYYVHSDHLQTPKLLTSAQKAIVWRSIKEAFGKTTVNEDVDGNGQSVVMNVRFPGQYFDGESGQHYNYFRDYDPGLGRYIESDPIGLKGGINSYAYVNGNPIRYVDPLGESPAGVAGDVIGKAIGDAIGAAIGTTMNSSGSRDLDGWWGENGLPNPDGTDREREADRRRQQDQDDCHDQCEHLMCGDDGSSYRLCVNTCMRNKGHDIGEGAYYY